MQEPFEKLNSLEERIKKAEVAIPKLESELKRVSLDYSQAMDRNEELVAKLKRYEDFENAFKALFPIPSSRDHVHAPPVSTGTTGTVEVRDPVKVIEVEDPQEPLKVDTFSLRGQIAKMILDGRFKTSMVSAGKVRETLQQEFGSAAEKWDADTVANELRTLAAPPFRLWTYTSNRMWRLRTGSEKRVKE